MTPPDSNPDRPEALQILLDASSMLLAAANESEVLTQILDLSSKVLFADAYAVWRQFDDGHTWRVVAQRGLSDSYQTELKATGQVPQAIWSIEDVLSDPRLAASHRAYEKEGIRSMLVVPLNLGPTVAGTIVFYWRTPRHFTQPNIDYASALANLSAAALNRVELYQQNLREKRRFAFLAEASAVLASSLDYEATLERVAHLAVPHIADWCTVHVLENGVPTRLVVAHSDPDMLAMAQDYANLYPEQIVPDRGLGMVLRTGEPEVFPHITEQMVALAARDDQHLQLLRKLALSSSILVPLKSRGKVLGAIRLLGAGTGRHFTNDDLQLAEDLARRAAVAIENAQLHRAVLEHESELRLSHAAAHMGSWSWDLTTQKLFWSDEFKALHGLPLDTPAGYEAGRHLIHPDDSERVLRELNDALNSGSDSVNQDHRALTPDGRVLWLQSRGRIQRDAAGKATRISGITIDITESRLAEQALRRTEKLAAAGRLAATVAHEVNNPLEALVNLVYLAQRTEGLPEEAANHLRIADSELSRMAHIVRQTLGFYRESAVPHSADLSTLVSEVLDLYRSRALTRGINLIHNAQPGITTVVNAGEIKQVVANLISNAIDATPPGGSVCASVGVRSNTLEITVTDTGTGISEANLKHLFEPFFTTKSDVGTGLGLWVSKGIVEKHGGFIAVDAPTSGTTMRVTLPLL